MKKFGLFKSRKIWNQLTAGMNDDQVQKLKASMVRNDDSVEDTIREIQNEQLKLIGIDFNDKRPEVGLDIKWEDITAVAFHVKDFDKNETEISEDGGLTKVVDSEPYGYLLVESPVLNFPTVLPITHKDDFRAMMSVWDHPEIKLNLEDRELLVTYIPQSKSSDEHLLHFAITPKGMLEDYYSDDTKMTSPELKLLFGELTYGDEHGVHLNTNPVRFKQISITLEAIKAGKVSNAEKKRISYELIRNASLFSSQMKELVERVNNFYEE